MCNHPRVAILLAVYNGEKYLKEQLDSIFSQLGVSVKVFASLDVSKDKSLSILRSYQNQIGYELEVLPYGHKFGSAGANFFRLMNDVETDSFDFVAFADQDDIWMPRKLFRAISQMKNSSSDGYSSNVTAFWENGMRKSIKKDYPQTDFDYLFESPGPGCTFVLSKQLSEELQNQVRAQYSNIQNLWLHDWYCYSFSRFKGFNWVIDSEPHMLYRQHDSNEVGANSGLSSFIDRVRVIATGEGLKKAIDQARFIGQEDMIPIKLAMSGSRLSMFKLALISYKCRRKYSHKLFMSLALCFMVFKGYKYEVKQ